MKKWLAACAALLIYAGSAAAAVRVADIYDAEVPVTGQDATERARVVHDALLEVLTRLAGARDFEQLPALKQALDQASHYVEQYRYRRLDAGGSTPTPNPPAVPAPPRQALWVRFDADAVERLLRDSGLPVWGQERPQTLVWVAVEDGEDRHLLGADTRDPVRGALEAEAKLRGVPLMFPLLDVEDRGRVRFADVWGGFTDTLQTASARYSPDAMLTVRVLHDGDGWNARWILDNQGRENTWTTRGGDLNQVLQGGIDGLADMLASRYGVQTGQREVADLVLHVSNVHGAADYARVGHYLESLAAVDQALLTTVTPEQLTYTVSVHGAASVLERSVALGNVLVPTSPPPKAEAAPVPATAPSPAPQPAAPDDHTAAAPAEPAAPSPALQELYYRLVP